MRIKGISALSLLVVTALGVVVDAPAASAEGASRRWSGPTSYTCAQHPGNVSVTFADQDVAFTGLAAGDRSVGAGDA